MGKINFIGIGVQKAGTSWLAEVLNEHPEIKIHPKKEAHFFNKKQFYFNNFHYEISFGSKKEKIIGEITPSYILDKKVAERIFKYNSKVKLIAILRDPTERCVSQYKMEMSRNTIEKNTGLWDAFCRDLPKYGPMKERGLYQKQLDRFYKFFNKEQILILDYEDIKKKPIAVIRKIFNYLQVDEKFVPKSLNKKIRHIKDTTKNIPINKDDIQKIKNYYNNFNYKTITKIFS